MYDCVVKTKQNIKSVLQNNELYAVYQPIISLKNGQIEGYEALSRINNNSNFSNLEEIFATAIETNTIVELEKLCIENALKNISSKPKEKKLFLNIDSSETLHKDSIKNIFEKKSISLQDIIFEITERSMAQTEEIVLNLQNEYENKDIKLAIDDFGAKNSGLSRVCKFKPEYLKLDMDLVRNIDLDIMKKAAISSIVSFCKDVSIKIIAEGIETEGELKTLIDLGVTYGQGFYISKPSQYFRKIPMWVTTQIIDFNKQKISKKATSFLGNIKELVKENPTTNYNANVFDLYEKMYKDHSHQDVFVLKENNELCGIIKRNTLMEKCSGLYGYNLAKKWYAYEVMENTYLELDEHTPIETGTTLAMERETENIYDAIAVTSMGKYIGTISVKDILLNFLELQVQKASESNPLTGLPGNSQVQKHIEKSIHSDSAWSIAYFDIDNFKAYNDAYGFSNGDRMIKMLAEILVKVFSKAKIIGHIGGDDFVVVGNYENFEDLHNLVFDLFNTEIQQLYRKMDWKAGYIVSTNRNGFVEKFPIATISSAVVTNKNSNFDTMNSLSETIAKAKKQAKLNTGNSLIVL